MWLHCPGWPEDRCQTKGRCINPFILPCSPSDKLPLSVSAQSVLSSSKELVEGAPRQIQNLGKRRRHKLSSRGQRGTSPMGKAEVSGGSTKYRAGRTGSSRESLKLRHEAYLGLLSVASATWADRLIRRCQRPSRRTVPRTPRPSTINASPGNLAPARPSLPAGRRSEAHQSTTHTSEVRRPGYRIGRHLKPLRTRLFKPGRTNSKI